MFLLILGAYGGPITVIILGIIFWITSSFVSVKKRNINKTEGQVQNQQTNLNKENLKDIPLSNSYNLENISSKTANTKRQIILFIELGFVFFMMFAVFYTRVYCSRIGGFCGLGTAYLIILLTPLFLIFVVSNFISSAKHIKLIKLNNYHIPKSLKLLNFSSKLILLVFLLSIISFIFFIFFAAFHKF